MPAKKAKQKFYKPDELLGALYQLMQGREIINFLEEKPWSHPYEISKYLSKPIHKVLFKLIDLHAYGFVDLRLEKIRDGHIANLYAVSDDYAKRVREIEKGLGKSEDNYYAKHPKYIRKVRHDSFKRFIKEMVHLSKKQPRITGFGVKTKK